MLGDRGARLVGRGIGISLVVVGVLVSYNLWFGTRVGGRLLEPLFFFGPVLLAGGLVLLALTRRGVAGLDGGGAYQRPRGLFLIGLSLVAVPTLLIVAVLATGDETFGFLATVTLIFLGLPGLALLLIAAAVWIANRVKTSRDWSSSGIPAERKPTAANTGSTSPMRSVRSRIPTR